MGLLDRGARNIIHNYADQAVPRDLKQGTARRDVLRRYGDATVERMEERVFPRLRERVSGEAVNGFLDKYREQPDPIGLFADLGMYLKLIGFVTGEDGVVSKGFSFLTGGGEGEELYAAVQETFDAYNEFAPTYYETFRHIADATRDRHDEAWSIDEAVRDTAFRDEVARDVFDGKEEAITFFSETQQFGRDVLSHAHTAREEDMFPDIGLVRDELRIVPEDKEAIEEFHDVLWEYQQEEFDRAF